MKFTQDEIEHGKLAAILCYIPFLCFYPLLMSNKNNYIRLHAKQGLLLLFIEAVALFFLIDFFNFLFWIVIIGLCILFSLIGIYHSIVGDFKPLPYIGKIFEKYEI